MQLFFAVSEKTAALPPRAHGLHGGNMITQKLVQRNLLAIVPRITPLAADRAQDATAPPSNSDESGLETIVVTGVASAGGVKKLEASYNIVTANEEEIRRANPKSTADLLKISPGMWPESTGGQTGANIEIAGFPGRRRRALLHDAADGLAAVRHADAVVLRDHQHLPPRRHHQVGGNPAGRTVGGVRRRTDGRDRQLPAEDRRGDARPAVSA